MQSVTVEISGERHVIRSEAPPEYTQAVAAHVDATIRALSPGNVLDPHRVAILAALVITDELFRVRRELQGLRDEVDGRAAALAELLERASADPRPGPPPEEPGD
jgi:cell division protein ZapA (FtsZ GTPase activity inhibitor)